MDTDTHGAKHMFFWRIVQFWGVLVFAGAVAAFVVKLAVPQE